MALITPAPFILGYGFMGPLVIQPTVSLGLNNEITFMSPYNIGLVFKPSVDSGKLTQIIKKIIDNKFDYLNKQLDSVKNDKNIKLRPCDELRRDLRKQVKEEINFIISVQIRYKFKQADKAKVDKISQDARTHFDKKMIELDRRISVLCPSTPPQLPPRTP